MTQSSYRPSKQVLDHLRQVDFVALIGPTAAGKTTLIKTVASTDPRFHMLVAGVSRAIRPGEKDGVDFHFGKKAEMLDLARQGKYVSAVIGATGDLYTTSTEDYPQGKMVMMAMMAQYADVFRALPFKSYNSVFVLPPSVEVWRERLKKHGFLAAELDRRLVEAKTSLRFGIQDKKLVFVVSDNLDKSAAEFIQLVTSRLQAEAQKDRCRAIIGSMLQYLDQIAPEAV